MILFLICPTNRAERHNTGNIMSNRMGVYVYTEIPSMSPASVHSLLFFLLYASITSHRVIDRKNGSNAGRVASRPSIIGQTVNPLIIEAISAIRVPIIARVARNMVSTASVLANADGNLTATGVRPSASRDRATK